MLKMAHPYVKGKIRLLSKFYKNMFSGRNPMTGEQLLSGELVNVLG